jgi:CrcB protein
MESALKCNCADDSYQIFITKEATMRNTLLVGAGGFIGSILRYHLSGFIQQLTRSAAFPYGTLAVNIVGCLLIGFLSQLAEARGVFRRRRGP